MTTINFYIGKFDKNTHKQELSNEFILNSIHRILTSRGVQGYTVTSCKGCYTHSDGSIVREPSYKVTVCNTTIPVHIICYEFKFRFNQESILVETYESNVACI